MLAFPTQAEQCKTAFLSATKTTSVATIAARMKASREKSWTGAITYTFDDDTTLVTTGAGRAHTITCHLP